jgi:hypothetical protein
MSRASWPLLALAIALACGCLAPSALAAPNGGISGKVTDATTHNPIEGIEVCAYSLASGSSEEEEVEGSFGCAKTGAGGEYSISGLISGNFGVVFQAPFTSTLNYVGQYYKDKLPPGEPDPVTVSAGNVTKEINAELQEGGEISGTITNASTGAAVEGAVACVLKSASPSGIEAIACAVSAANGEYTVRGIPDGSFEVGFLGLGLSTQYYPGKATFAEGTPISILAAKEVKTGIDAAMQPRAPTPPTGGESEPGRSGSPGLGGLPGGGAPAGPRGGAKLPVALTSPLVSVEHRAVALVKLACTAAAGCRGKLILSIERSTRRKGKRIAWSVPLGAERYSLRHGASATVRIRLDAHARALLRSARGSVGVRLMITQRASSPRRIERESVILVEHKAKAGH